MEILIFHYNSIWNPSQFIYVFVGPKYWDVKKIISTQFLNFKLFLIHPTATTQSIPLSEFHN